MIPSFMFDGTLSGPGSNWQARKQRKTAFGDNKNRPGISPSEIRKRVAAQKASIEASLASAEGKAKEEARKVIIVG